MNQTFKQAVTALADDNQWKCISEISCTMCGAIEPELEFNPNNSGWKASCSRCGKYIKFVPHTDVVYIEQPIDDDAEWKYLMSIV